MTPIDLAPRVLRHVRTRPDLRLMEPTRRTAMWAARDYSRGLNGTYQQTFRFHLDNTDILEQNIAFKISFHKFVYRGFEFTEIERGSPGSLLWTRIPYSILENFLKHTNLILMIQGMILEEKLAHISGDEGQRWLIGV